MKTFWVVIITTILISSIVFAKDYLEFTDMVDNYASLTLDTYPCIVFSGKPEIKICEDGFFVDGEKITRNKTMYYKLKRFLEGTCCECKKEE